MNDTNTRSVKISAKAYAELLKRKENTGVPITKQIDRLLNIKKEGK